MPPYRFPLKFGKYLLTRRVAVGGMAEVFKAKLLGIKGFEKVCAVKKILPEFNEDEEFVQMFVDEARISSHLEHNNIVRITDFGVVEGSYYLAMEYIDGPNLKNFAQRILKRKSEIPRNVILYILLQIARGLEYAHSARIEGQDVLNLVHRDISPQNIILSRTGDVKITDFGIAKAAIKLSRTQPGKIQGKFSYMSPEQAAGRPLDRRSDIFSLGIISYELLSGIKLYASEDTHRRYAEVREAKVRRLGEIVPDLSAQVESLVMRMLEKNPDDRPGSCSEIVSELAEIVGNISTSELSGKLGVLVDEYFPREASDSDASQTPPQPPSDSADSATPAESENGEKKETTKPIEEEPTITGDERFPPILAGLALFTILSSIGALIFYVTRDKSPSVPASEATPTSTPSSNNKAETIPHRGPIDADLQAAARAREVEVEERMRELEEQLRLTEEKAEDATDKLAKAEEKLKTVRADSQPPSCPNDMAHIRGGNFLFGSDRSDADRNDLVEPIARSTPMHRYCIDRYEYPNQSGKLPQVSVPWAEAQSLCAAKGKRLCAQEEWERACKGPTEGGNRRYPYGNRFDSKACNTEIAEGEEPPKLVPAGSHNRCVSPEGVFDLSGNVEEWTSARGKYSPESHVTRGGSRKRPGSSSRCSSIHELVDSSKENDVGFRCCKDAL